jgi:hypothetical protein
MALATVNANLVRQKVYATLTSATGTSAGSGDPSAWYAFKAFFLSMAANKGNPDLQYLPVNSADTIGSSGQDHGIDAACQLYAIYLKKGSSATDSYYVLYDDATDDCDGATDARISVGFLEAGDIFFAFYPNGLPFAAGLVSVSFTDFDGTTKSTTAAAAQDGFLIVGA